jgi:hypothetical protein
MTIEQQDLERAVRAWVAQGSEQLPDPALDAALQEIATTPQYRSRWTTQRFPIMNNFWFRLGVAAVVLVAAAAIGLRFLPLESVGPAPVSTPTPSPTPIALASGTFTARFTEPALTTITIEATGRGANVSGEMEVSEQDTGFSIDLQCARTMDNGILLIGGEITASTREGFDEGSRVAVVLQPGTNVSAALWFEDPPAASCPAFLEDVPDDVEIYLKPIQGDLELAP